jgi:DNA-binding transcriptional LysR family regulator
VNAAEEFIQMQHNEPQGVLKIYCSIVYAEAYLNKNLHIFHAQYPRLKLEITIGDIIPDMERENFDLVLGFTLLPQFSVHLRQRKLFSTRYMLCASPSYLQQYGEPLTLEDLKTHKLLAHPIRQPINTVSFADGTKIYMQTPEISINNMRALLILCSNACGILMVSEMQAQEFLDQKK